MANMVEQGDTPVLSASALQEMGYKIAIYPASLMLAGIQAMEASLAALAAGQPTTEAATFMHLQDLVGFPDYYEAEKRYAAD
jgi:2-methylisocitrate lyase-like PEP mutase family enzyme